MGVFLGLDFVGGFKAAILDVGRAETTATLSGEGEGGSQRSHTGSEAAHLRDV